MTGINIDTLNAKLANLRSKAKDSKPEDFHALDEEAHAIGYALVIHPESFEMVIVRRWRGTDSQDRVASQQATTAMLAATLSKRKGSPA